jgi:hypothetical protein
MDARHGHPKMSQTPKPHGSQVTSCRETDRHGQPYTGPTPKPSSSQVESCRWTDMANPVWPPLYADRQDQPAGCSTLTLECEEHLINETIRHFSRSLFKSARFRFHIVTEKPLLMFGFEIWTLKKNRKPWSTTNDSSGHLPYVIKRLCTTSYN